MRDPSEKTHEAGTVSLWVLQRVAAHSNEMQLSYIFHTSTVETALCRSYRSGLKWTRSSFP